MKHKLQHARNRPALVNQHDQLSSRAFPQSSSDKTQAYSMVHKHDRLILNALW